MYNIYRTDYSNQVHQLVVSVSRHYYVTQQGKYKFQKKPFAEDLENLNSPRTHIVHYLIRDHFSGLFYAELTHSKDLISVYEFLFRAWSEKAEHPFCGVPLAITVPKNVQRVWPQLISSLGELGIGIIEVTSGFQGGIRDVRTWEHTLRCGRYESGFPPDYSEVKSKAPTTCLSLAKWSSKGMAREWKWRTNLRQVFVPISEEAFVAKHDCT